MFITKENLRSQKENYKTLRSATLIYAYILIYMSTKAYKLSDQVPLENL
jgi:hypothetical protein